MLKLRNENTYQWALRTANERRANTLINIPAPVIKPTPAPKFVRVDYGYFKWDGGYDKYEKMIETAYGWGIKNNKTKKETAEKFNTSERNLWQYAQNNKLPKLKA